MRAQVGRREPEFFSQVVAAHHGPQNGVIAPEHLGGFGEVAGVNSLPDRGAAHNLAIPQRHSLNPDDVEIPSRAQFSQQLQSAAPIFSERPFVANADFAQRF